MSRDPVSDNGGEFADLQIEASIVPRRETDCVFIHSNLCALIAWIETTVQPRLREKINLFSQLTVQKKREPRIKQIVDLAIDESGRGLIKVIKLGIEGAA